jgi:hypothetical protein
LSPTRVPSASAMQTQVQKFESPKLCLIRHTGNRLLLRAADHGSRLMSRA